MEAENWFTLQIPGKDKEWETSDIYECHQIWRKNQSNKQKRNSVAIKTMQRETENFQHRGMKASKSLKRSVYIPKNIYRMRDIIIKTF